MFSQKVRKLNDDIERYRKTMEDRMSGQEGTKHDQGKPRLGYVIKEQFPLALIEVAKVSTFGIDKYGEGNWQHVATERYVDASMRHAVAKGTDDDTGLLHLAHEAWNVLAQLELEMRGAHDETKRASCCRKGAN